MTVRRDLAAALQGALGPGVQVWDHPVRQSAVPCVMIRPSRPEYRTRAPAQSPCYETWRLIVSAFVPREQADALDALDALGDTIRDAARVYPETRWLGVSAGMEADDLGGVPVYRSDATLEVGA
jgi:hypothetical protein